MTHPTSKISIVANTWVKQMYFAKAGDINEGHTHTFDHQTLLGKGKVKVTVNNKVTEFTAPTIIFIRAGFMHEIEALEDDTICYCIHAIRDGEKVEDIVDPEDIPEGGMETSIVTTGKAFVTPTPKQYLK
jgi:dTDP-4-dehydrorhamnose 3,5-epimerase-like enzyme